MLSIFVSEVKVLASIEDILFTCNLHPFYETFDNFNLWCPNLILLMADFLNV